MTHALIGYPSLKLSVEIVLAMEKGGADFIELQIPFSDPLADGPTIMRASEKALEQGTKVRDAFYVANILKRKISTPLLLMAYYNTIFKCGIEKFCRKAKAAGGSGLIVPDMPLEEELREHFSRSARESNLCVIRVVAPVSTDERLRKNATAAQGFVYCSARQGITGAHQQLLPHVVSYLKKTRKFFKIPLAVGFGISKPEHLTKLSSSVDIVVVGSAIIDLINRSEEKTVPHRVAVFVRSLKEEC